MTIWVVYDKNGKCCGYFLQNEKHLAELWVDVNGGHIEQVKA